MTGVILCGGQSTRMHTDKGLLMAGRYTWTEHLALLLQPLCNNLVISVNPHQKSYQTKLPGYRLITDDGKLGIFGPLTGLLSVHQQMPAEDIFLLACDMQQMVAGVLETLAESYRSNPGFEAWVFVQPDGMPEPLTAIYSANAMAALLKKHHQTPLLRHSMRAFLDQLNLFKLQIPVDRASCFANFNHPDEAKKVNFS